jgi:uncharacterized protein (TIGR03435 family)
MKSYVLALTLLSVIAATTAASQTAGQKPQFEVTSVKPNTTERSGFGDMPPTGRVNIVGMTFRTLLRMSYGVEDYQIIGGPAWLAVDRFDVQASPPAEYRPQPVARCVVNCPPTPVQIMMQGLLADRFQLKLHRETRELPVYVLTIAKNGLKLKEVLAPPPTHPGSGPPPLPPPPPPGTTPPTTAAALPTPPPGIAMSFPFGVTASGVELRALVSQLEEILSGLLSTKRESRDSTISSSCSAAKGFPTMDPRHRPVRLIVDPA